MSSERDVTRIVRSWLDDGATRLSDRVLDQVLDALPATPQRRPLWSARRFNEMNTPIKYAIVAAAVIVVALIGINLLPREPTSSVGGPPSPTASPNPTASPSPSSSLTGSASPMPYVEPAFLDAGTYALPPRGGNPGFTFTVPQGWESRFEVLWKDRTGPGEVAFGAWTVANVFADPCRWQDSLLDPPVGPTIDDLATALEGQAGRAASPATDVTFGGYPAKRMEISIPAGLDVSTCDEGKFRTWLASGENVEGADVVVVPSVQLQGRVDVLYIIDVGGFRWVMDAWHLPGTPAPDLTELQDALDSIVIQP